MKKFINNKKILKKNIFRISSPRKSRFNKIRLDKNERYDSHKKIFFKKLLSNFTNEIISAYPEYYKAYELLSKSLGVKKKNLLFTAGSDQALKNTFELYYKKNKKVITVTPTFAMVDIYCKIFKTKQIKIGYDSELKLNLSHLLSSIDKNTSLIVIANPNSPTGTVLDNKSIDKILIKARRFRTKVLIDEAYYEFSKYNCLNKIKKYNNLIIIRTFSKIFGLAGLRCGYVLSNSTTIKEYTAIKPMYEINSIAVKAVELMLSNKRIINLYLKELREGEKYAQEFCKKNNYKFIKCHANFFHVAFKYDPLKIQKFLEDNNILIKGGPGTNAHKNFLRISFANKPTIKKTLKLIKSFLDKKR